jgi:uncharacterized membrane protein
MSETGGLDGPAMASPGGGWRGGAARSRATAVPEVRALTVDDITLALAAGLRDFRAAPGFGLFFGGVYVAAGLALMYVVSELSLYYLAYPIAAGFALIAPLVAVGLYEVSRSLERGERPHWGPVLGAIRHHGARELGYMALVALFGLLLWVYAAGFLYALFFGLKPLGLGELVSASVSTPNGIAFLMLGNLVGTFIAALLFSVSVVSYPLLIDRDIDFVTAMATSVRAVVAAPAAMIGWAVFIGFLLVVAILPMFLGLVLVLPLLGHATWHLYRRVVPAAGDGERAALDPRAEA